jgi:hypothetical protein
MSRPATPHRGATLPMVMREIIPFLISRGETVTLTRCRVTGHKGSSRLASIKQSFLLGSTARVGRVAQAPGLCQPSKITRPSGRHSRRSCR